MHPFSIDYITQNSAYGQPLVDMKDFDNSSLSDTGDDCRREMSTGTGRRYTPSPSDSGLDNSPTSSDSIFTGNSESIAEVLLSLDKVKQSPDNGDKKPSQSYIALISMAILSTSEKKALLCDIYQYIMDNFGYYNNKEKAWRNSVRHNLSLNECFIKNGRADNGKGNFWAIHPACEEDFAKGDFRRRQARRRARKSLKDSCVREQANGYKYNVGYVPMTPYHPYGAPLYYPQLSSYTPTTQAQTPTHAQSHVHPLLGHVPSSSGNDFKLSATQLSQISQLSQSSYLPTPSGSAVSPGSLQHRMSPPQSQRTLAEYQSLGLMATGIHHKEERQLPW